ncbi:MAG: sigma-70 family RNA polymerase sigma factor [Eubacteriales bacterium]|jgi:RNA polymerase sigma-70 factor (ECF subfamily)
MEVRIILKNKDEVLTECMESYSGLIFTICYSMTRDHFEAEDLAQDTFISAYRNLENFDGINMKAWLTTIAANKCRDYLKNSSRKTTPSPDESFLELKDTGPLPEESLLRKDSEKRLVNICRKLKEPYRSIAMQHFWQNKSAEEIAKESQKSIRTIQTQIYRTKALLRTLWKEEYR